MSRARSAADPRRDPLRPAVRDARGILRALAARRSELGLDWASVFDHFLPIHSDPTGPCFEGLTLLSAMARAHERCAAASSSSASTYRHPAVLAKMARRSTTSPAAGSSSGSAPAWFELEHDQYGFPFPRIGVRMDMLDEACQIVRAPLDERARDLRGTSTSGSARPAASRSRSRSACRSGSAAPARSERFGSSPSTPTAGTPFCIPRTTTAHKLDVLAGHCADVGRDPGTIRRSFGFQAVLDETEDKARQRAGDGVMPTAVIGTPEQLVERFAPYVELGVRDFLLLARPPVDPVTMEFFARRRSRIAGTSRGLM